MHLAKRILTAFILIPVVLALILRAPIAVLAGVAGAIALLAVRELLGLAEKYELKPLRTPTYLFVAAFFFLLAVAASDSRTVPSTAIFIFSIGMSATLAAFLFLLLVMHRADLSRAFPAAMVSVFAFCYVALPLGFLVQLREQWSGAFLLLYLLLVVWAGDIFAYFVGASLGRHAMAPRISPKKTWEGALASLLASLLVGFLLYDHALGISSALLNAHLIERRGGYFALQKVELWPVLLLSGAINIAAQFGDLAESLIKRGAGVKDSGAILPGHGGMLDRIDALLFAAPVLWFYATWQVIR